MIDRPSRAWAETLAIVAVTVCLSSACGTGNAPSAPPSSTPDFPYPPFEIDTDVAVPLPQPLLDAAKFALEMSVDGRLKNDPHDDEIDRRFRSRIAPQADITDLPPAPTVVGETGGALHRAVGARDLPNGSVEVSLCLYDTPGLYAELEDGTVVGPDSRNPFTLQRPLVRWTDEPAADGSTSEGPRWLWVGEEGSSNLSRDEIAAICEPFKPEPFIQTMPSPTPPATTSAPR